MHPRRYTDPEVEPLPGAVKHAFLHRDFNQPHFDFIWHCHPEFELTYIRQGYGARYVGNSIQPFFEGDLCLLGGNLLHAYGSHPRYEGNCRWSVFHFLPSTWGNPFWKLPENRRVDRLLRGCSAGFSFARGHVEEVRDRIDHLSSSRLSDGWKLLGFLEILQKLSLAVPERLNPAVTEARTADPRITMVLHWLEERATEDIRQAEVAALVGMSTAAFSRFFFHRTGRLFSRHLNEMRVAHARAMVTATDKSISEIAFESGFGSLANFNRRFREMTGMTPRDYRRNL